MTPLEIHQQRLIINAIRRSLRKAIKRTEEKGVFLPEALAYYQQARRFSKSLVGMQKEI
jgi:hypothetical protein